MAEIRQDSEDTKLTPWRLEAIGVERSFVVDGHVWTVREVIDPISLAHVLIFASTGVGRRVRHYPANWRELSSDELRMLSWSR